jgi:hypothetical protein
MVEGRYDDGTVTVAHRGVDLFRYRAVTTASKPHVDRLAMPPDAGPLAGRNIVLAGAHDHPWHLGVFYSPKYVDGVNCWEYEDRGERSEPCARAIDCGHDFACHDGQVEIEQTVEWRRDGGESLLADERTVGVDVSLDRGYLVTWEQTVTALGSDRRVEGSNPDGGRGSYGGFSLRFVRSMADGTVLLPDAEDPGDRSGPTGRYCAYTGLLDGRRGSTTPWRASCTVMVDSLEERLQRWFVARGYPFVGANPTWGEAASVQSGDSRRWRWGVWVHDGQADRVEIESVYERFANDD